MENKLGSLAAEREWRILQHAYDSNTYLDGGYRELLMPISDLQEMGLLIQRDGGLHLTDEGRAFVEAKLKEKEG